MKDVAFCLRRLLGVAWRLDRRRFVVGAGLLLLGAIATPVVAIGAGRLVDHVVAGDVSGASVWAVVVAVALTGDLMLGHFAHLYYFELAEQTEEHFNRELLHLVNGSDHLDRTDDPAFADRVDLLRQDVMQMRATVQTGLQLGATAVQVLLTAVVLATVSPWLLVLAAFAVAPVVLGRRAESALQEVREEQSATTRSIRSLRRLATSPASQKEIRLGGGTDFLLARQRALLDTYDDAMGRADTRYALLRATGQIVFGVAYVAAVLGAFWLAREGRASVGQVVLTITLATQLSVQMSAGIEMLGSVHRAAAGLRRFLALEVEVAADPDAPAGRVAAATGPGDRGLPDDLSDGIRLEGVTFGGVARGIRRGDGTSEAVRVELGPPPVEDRQVERAVERRLHARGSARLERPQRVVEPHVAARVELLRHADVVVGQEDDATAHLGVLRKFDEQLDEALAAVVGGVRLAGDDELHGALGIGEQRTQAGRVLQHEREALVGGDAAGEADREHVGRQQLAIPRRRGHARVLLLPGFDHAAAGVVDKLLAQPPPQRPQLGIAHGIRGPVARGRVVGAEAGCRERAHLGIGPGGGVHAVRDGGDGHVGRVEARPQRAEHVPADVAVQLRDAVGALREAQAHDGHVEGVGGAALVVFRAEREHVGDVDARQQLGREVALDERCLEAVDARRHGRVGREDGARAHDLERLGEAQPLGDEPADALEPEEPRVPLVGVEDGGLRDAGETRVERDGPRAPDAEQQLLQKTVLSPAAVETVGDGAELLRVLGDVGVEQKERHATDGELPDAGRERLAVGKGEHDLRRRAVGRAEHAHGQSVGVEHGVALELPALPGDRLAEVAGAVEEADADDRHTEVGRRLEVVAREDAEAARVLGQRIRDPVLGREVGDRGGHVGAEALVPARLGEVGVQLVAEGDGARDVGLVGGELLEACGRHLAEETVRVLA